jgi:hypothetical protein
MVVEDTTPFFHHPSEVVCARFLAPLFFFKKRKTRALFLLFIFLNLTRLNASRVLSYVIEKEHTFLFSPPLFFRVF